MRSAASSSPRSRRAPASTMVSSASRAGRELLLRRVAHQRQRTVGTAQRALAVGHDRDVVLDAVHPLGGTQLGQCLGVLPRGVGRLAHGLAHDGQPAGARPGGQGVLVGGLRLGVDQQAGGHQVAGHPLGQLVGQRLQLRLDRAVELLAGDLLGDRRAVVALPGSRCARRRRSRSSRRGRLNSRLPPLLPRSRRPPPRPASPPRRPLRAGRPLGCPGRLRCCGACAADGLRARRAPTYCWFDHRCCRKRLRAAPRGAALSKSMSGDVLLSHDLPVAVPSALKGLTSGFGMEPGISLSLWPPKLYGVMQKPWIS